MKNEAYLREKLLRMSGVDPRRCMRCGKCSATCPAYDEMEYHPHQFVQMIDNGRIEPLLRSPSIFKCLSCYACIERCPRQVEPAKLVEAVRNLVEREKGGSHMTADDLPGRIDPELPQQALAAAMRKYRK
ncbi:MAG: 4Fe-4S dicluster domain-containing protein [Eubacteriales bacterium]|nr:4Fe-4S dicluster domain-containing protein [Eubacteriales bacterium]